MKEVQLIECPRDAMQGWKTFIPTEKKARYLNALLQVGFGTLDFGSFVSPKAIPQMADTRQVFDRLDLSGTTTRLLAIVANVRGAEEAVALEQIHYLGFPFSVSPTFQWRNTHSTPEESLRRVEQIQALCVKHQKELVVYLSMAFGNPYGDEYHEGVLAQWAEAIQKRGIRIISLADTVGLATPAQVGDAFSALIPLYRDVTFGAHLHSTAAHWKAKLAAAYRAGCRRFDGALKGIGGCPMADDELVGNLATEWMLAFFEEQHARPPLNEEALKKSIQLANEIFV